MQERRAVSSALVGRYLGRRLPSRLWALSSLAAEGSLGCRCPSNVGAESKRPRNPVRPCESRKVGVLNQSAH
jgi:hypothetical protein